MDIAKLPLVVVVGTAGMIGGLVIGNVSSGESTGRPELAVTEVARGSTGTIPSTPSSTVVVPETIANDPVVASDGAAQPTGADAASEPASSEESPATTQPPAPPTTSAPAPPTSVPSPPTTQPAAPSTTTTTVPAPTTTTTQPQARAAYGTSSPPDNVEACDRYLFERINQVRGDEGVRALLWDGEIHEIPTHWSTQMSFEHELSHNSAYRQQLNAAGRYPSRLGETVAEASSMVELVDTWLASPPHYEVLTDPLFTHAAVGCARSEDGRRWGTFDLHSG